MGTAPRRPRRPRRRKRFLRCPALAGGAATPAGGATASVRRQEPESPLVPKILFLSEACLLDRRSGAAHSVRAMLHALAAAGWQVRAATLNLCDGDAEAALQQRYPQLDPQAHAGERVTLADGALLHEVLVARSTRQRLLRPWELRAFHDLARATLGQWRPDLVLSYGSALSRPLLARAQRLGARTVLYIAHAAWARRQDFSAAFVDVFITPSQALAALCREAHGIEPRVVRDIVARPFDGARNLQPARIAARRQRWVTMVNPDPQKGGLFFINVAAQAAALAPGLRFRALQGRWGRADWVRLGVAEADLARIDWQPETDDMARVYDEAALVLMPSLGFEASGRVVGEALLAGVPVLAMRSGGIPEQLGDGGLLFDVPPALAGNPLAAPPAAHAQRWAQFVEVLMRDDVLYTRAVQLALQQAGATLEPAMRAAQAVDTFQALEQPLAAGVGETGADARALLAAQRRQMNTEREAANARAEAGEDAAAPRDTPYRALIERSLLQPVLREALAAVNGKDWSRARTLLEQFLRLMPGDITALGLLAEVAHAEARDDEARELLERVVELAPGFMQGQQRLVWLLQRTGDVQSALAHSFALIEHAPNEPRYLALHADLLVGARRFGEAIAVYEAFLRQRPGHAHDWMQYALALQAVGRQADAIEAYRKAIVAAPRHGAAWYALARTKPAEFDAGDIDYLDYLSSEDGLPDEDRIGIQFALGEVHEHRKDYARSFEHYASANRIRRGRSDCDVGRIEDYVAQVKETCTREFFAARAGGGDAASDPVFVLGLHCAGSTLVEQILASHSRIEGTRELPHLLRIGRDFGGLGPRGQGRDLHAALLLDVDPAERARLGRQYLGLCAAERHTDRPMFVDKMPANWMYAGLIHLILPQARIVDVRREPMAAGFALFKTNFGHGVDHGCDQRDIARYYRAYAELMAHFDAVLPGRVHHIRYEALVEDTEAEIRRLLDYCGLPFEESCLRYRQARRAMQTPDSEQVRQPIDPGALVQWRHYEAWLGPMREAFGDLACETTVGEP